jgi:hypothetical protein
MLSVIMLSVFVLNVIMLNVVMLNVVMLSVVMLNVVVPIRHGQFPKKNPEREKAPLQAKSGNP